MAATRPACASRVAAQIASYAARPASADSTPGSKRASGGGPYRIGSQTSRTRGSSLALRAISGPMPAGSPTVIAMRGVVVRVTGYRLQASTEDRGVSSAIVSRRWTVLAGACLLTALAILAARPLLVRDRYPEINVRWRMSLDVPARAALERRFSLEPVQQVAADTWRYELMDPSRDNVAGLVRHEDAADTHFINRTTFEVEEDAVLGQRRPGPLGEPWPALAYRVVDIGPLTFAAMGAVAALCAAWPGKVQAIAVRTRAVLTRGVPELSPRSLAIFRLVFGVALALYVSSQPFEDVRVPPDALRTDAPLVDVAPIHWLANHPASVRAGQWTAVAGFTLFALGILPRLTYTVSVAATAQWLLALTLRTGSHPFGVLLLPLLCLLTVPWGDAPPLHRLRLRRAFAEGAAAKRYGYAPWLLSLALGIAFAGAGWAKLRDGPGWVLNGTVRYHFVTDFQQARVDWGLAIATMPRVALLLSAGAVLVEGLTIVAAFVRMPVVRLGTGVAAMSLLVGFHLFQGLMWSAWWILLLGFLPWQWFDRPVQAAMLSRASTVSLAQIVCLLGLGLQQIAISAAFTELEPFSSRFDMYSKTHGSPADYDRDNPGIERRILTVDRHGNTRDVTDCVARFDQPAVEAFQTFDPATSAPSTASFKPCHAQGEPPQRYLVLESQCRFDWEAGRFFCPYRDRVVATLPVSN